MKSLSHESCPHTHIFLLFATHCNTLQHGATHHAATHCDTLQHAATRCNTLQHAATRCNSLFRNRTSNVGSLFGATTASHRNTLQHTASQCHTLQHTATHSITLQQSWLEENQQFKKPQCLIQEWMKACVDMTRASIIPCVTCFMHV